MQAITLTTAIAGLVFGLLGAVLGILNTWRAFDRDRVRIKVVPVWTLNSNGRDGFGISVTNLSQFPVTVREVGFTVVGSDTRMTYLPSDILGCKLPERMEPRTSFTAYLPIPSTREPWAGIGVAYAETACGSRFTGTSPALKQKINGRA